MHGCLLYALQNTNISLPSLTLLSLFGSPWIRTLNSCSCSFTSQAELAFSLRNQHLQTGVDTIFTPSITLGNMACRWPIPLALSLGQQHGPGKDLSSLTGQSHL